MSELKQDRFTEGLALQEKRSLAVYKGWLLKHPEVRDCTANEKAFREYADFTDGLVEADFDFTLSNIRERLALQYVPTEAEIVAAENKHRKSLSLPTLQKLARDENPAAPQREQLPLVWQDIDVSTAAALKQLAKTNIRAFKALCSRFGTDLVNERLGATKSKPVGRSITLNL